MPFAFKEAEERFADVIAAPELACWIVAGHVSLDGGSANLGLWQSCGAGPIEGRCDEESQNGIAEG
jgi:hypothetical protein